jgi:hypothetical protein
MAVRLLHWFPRAKKAGGWVYKWWRDWNAECNLSQAQVKRVHGKGFLETIGIERTIMKANGTPTVHYHLDENQLIQKLGEFLEIMPLCIKMWMWTETPDEDGQSNLKNVADVDQLDELNQPHSCGKDEPIHSVEIVQSIQTLTHKQNSIKTINLYNTTTILLLLWTLKEKRKRNSSITWKTWDWLLQGDPTYRETW